MTHFLRLQHPIALQWILLTWCADRHRSGPCLFRATARSRLLVWRMVPDRADLAEGESGEAGQSQSPSLVSHTGGSLHADNPGHVSQRGREGIIPASSITLTRTTRAGIACYRGRSNKSLRREDSRAHHVRPTRRSLQACRQSYTAAVSSASPSTTGSQRARWMCGAGAASATVIAPRTTSGPHLSGQPGGSSLRSFGGALPCASWPLCDNEHPLSGGFIGTEAKARERTPSPSPSGSPEDAGLLPTGQAPLVEWDDELRPRGHPHARPCCS